MARFSRAIANRPVNSVKHIVDVSQALAGGVDLSNDLIKSVDNPIFGNTNEVATASIVKWIYLTVEVQSNEQILGAIPNFYMIVFKDPGADLTQPDPAAAGISDLRKFIIHQEMVMINNVKAGNPRVVFKGVIKIPKRYQRFGQNDKLIARFTSNTIDVVMCLQCIYKEFR